SLTKDHITIQSFFFFFQAEDGIRDRNVTGVQTCALPIAKGAAEAARRAALAADAAKRNGAEQAREDQSGMRLDLASAIADASKDAAQTAADASREASRAAEAAARAANSPTPDDVVVRRE